MQLLAPRKLWCATVYRTPGFDTAPCAAELGCKLAGRPPEPSVTILPASQVTESVVSSGSSGACYSIPMGRAFIQIGEWRFAAVDANHLSLSHKDGQTAAIWRQDGYFFSGPRTDWGGWDRAIGPSEWVTFGFQYIEIGFFRLAAIDNYHFSISHKSGNTVQIFRYDGVTFDGPRADWGSQSRPESAPVNIYVGEDFLQLGWFRLGQKLTGGNMNFAIAHKDGKTLEMWSEPGQRYTDVADHYAVTFWSRSAASWTCEDIAQMAHGPCGSFGLGFGDRFIRVGDWRIGALDSERFAIVHKDGQTPAIFGADGAMAYQQGVAGAGLWSRPEGFPAGITMGPGFLQFGNFRLAAMDDWHMSVSHKDGQTSYIWRGTDGTVHPGPRTDWSAWGVGSQTAVAITYGDRFLQIGKFRLGVRADDTDYLLVTHITGEVTVNLYRKNGQTWSNTATDPNLVNLRHPKWHCGPAVPGLCSGITTGENFIQFGKFRLAAMDNFHLTVSHQDGQTQMVWRYDNVVETGPRTDWNSWGREPKEVSSSTRLAFGDRFIQIGQFRLGAWNQDDYFSISHSNNNIPHRWKQDGSEARAVLSGSTSGSLWNSQHPVGEPLGVSFGDRFVQIGPFRLGDVDGTHFTLAVSGRTLFTFHDQGTSHAGGDLTTFGREIQPCSLYGAR